MRTFDYRRLPKRLFEGDLADAAARLHEDKGKLDMLRRLHPDRLDALREQAHFDNVDASTRIEGLYVDAPRVRELIAGADPVDETESQIVGYSNALRLVEDATEDVDLSTSSVLALYETLYAHRALGRKSRYRKKDYLYVQVDGHMQAMPVSPISAFETPLVFGGACDSLVEAFDAGSCSPLVLAAVFTVDFLCIRPFDEGNGRIARLYADMLLMKAGFDVARYSSIDRVIEKSAMAYYDALNACVDGWDRSANDCTPFALYWFNAVHEAYQQLFDQVEQDLSGATGKSERVRRFVQHADGPVTKRALRDALTDVSESTIENVLGKLVKEGVVEKVGAGRATAYRWR
jgi:Fic family protein